MENIETKWYVIHTYSGHEAKVKQNVEYRVAIEGYKNLVKQVIIPVENIVEIKDGKKRAMTRNLMPGYVLIEMVPNDDLFNMVKKISGVSGFVGDGIKPIPLTEEEIRNVRDMVEVKHDKPKPKIKYRQGDQVRVIEGPFSNFVGTVNEIDEEKAKIKMMVSIFGRPTPVELDVMQVESV
ncbi:MAG TPA: transcription termination/antitermination protein NusG [Candidatus Sumerlaeota bacterium]|nr:transcription termination/antitermination protein NusG [Candidatus Sumerlaeota bacterium]HRR30827.1 transcription termination/antitermination protein NusG [Candidatus Sumerlaeia bacterium]HON50965.1 transcription termination/antitermination protein NusG [Candidatus Sumerlaeota bacterium]HOR65659.1 transcription termination/antitermination protein NusG [Candidatus Sumerlaeota bacterium]HPL74668.1 transcription termination/antitermination protein NusG [Candidatus Sumerlaeota bacterium]